MHCGSVFFFLSIASISATGSSEDISPTQPSAKKSHHGSRGGRLIKVKIKKKRNYQKLISQKAVEENRCRWVPDVAFVNSVTSRGCCPHAREVYAERYGDVRCCSGRRPSAEERVACDGARPNDVDALGSALFGRKVVIIGDSMAEQTFVGILCALWENGVPVSVHPFFENGQQPGEPNNKLLLHSWEAKSSEFGAQAQIRYVRQDTCGYQIVCAWAKPWLEAADIVVVVPTHATMYLEPAKHEATFRAFLASVDAAHKWLRPAQCEIKIDGNCRKYPKMTNKSWFRYGGSTGTTHAQCEVRRRSWIVSCENINIQMRHKAAIGATRSAPPLTFVVEPLPHHFSDTDPQTCAANKSEAVWLGARLKSTHKSSYLSTPGNVFDPAPFLRAA